MPEIADRCEQVSAVSDSLEALAPLDAVQCRKDAPRACTRTTNSGAHMASQPPPKTDAIALLKQDHANVKELGGAFGYEGTHRADEKR